MILEEERFRPAKLLFTADFEFFSGEKRTLTVTLISGGKLKTEWQDYGDTHSLDSKVNFGRVLLSAKSLQIFDQADDLYVINREGVDIDHVIVKGESGVELTCSEFDFLIAFANAQPLAYERDPGMPTNQSAGIALIIDDKDSPEKKHLTVFLSDGEAEIDGLSVLTARMRKVISQLIVFDENGQGRLRKDQKKGYSNEVEKAIPLIPRIVMRVKTLFNPDRKIATDFVLEQLDFDNLKVLAGRMAEAVSTYPPMAQLLKKRGEMLQIRAETWVPEEIGKSPVYKRGSDSTPEAIAKEPVDAKEFGIEIPNIPEGLGDEELLTLVAKYIEQKNITRIYVQNYIDTMMSGNHGRVNLHLPLLQQAFIKAGYRKEKLVKILNDYLNNLKQ